MAAVARMGSRAHAGPVLEEPAAVATRLHRLRDEGRMEPHLGSTRASPPTDRTEGAARVRGVRRRAPQHPVPVRPEPAAAVAGARLAGARYPGRERIRVHTVIVPERTVTVPQGLCGGSVQLASGRSPRRGEDHGYVSCSCGGGDVWTEPARAGIGARDGRCRTERRL